MKYSYHNSILWHPYGCICSVEHTKGLNERAGMDHFGVPDYQISYKNLTLDCEMRWINLGFPKLGYLSILQILAIFIFITICQPLDTSILSIGKNKIKLQDICLFIQISYSSA